MAVAVLWNRNNIEYNSRFFDGVYSSSRTPSTDVVLSKTSTGKCTERVMETTATRMDVGK